MKGSRILVLELLLIFLLGTSAYAAVSDYPTAIWSQIDYTVGDETKSIMISIEGVVGRQIEEGMVDVAELPVTVIDLYAYLDVMENEDGTFTVMTENGEAVMSRDELIAKYADNSVKIIPVVDGATMVIKNLKDGYVDFYPSGYDFIDKNKTILAKEAGQVTNYDQNVPYVFRLGAEATDGINDFAYDFPVILLIDGAEVSYGILPVSEEKAAELLATLSETGETAENETATEESQESEAVVEETQENTVAIEETVYTANPSTTKFELNGNPVSLEAYLIGNNNYVKLREIAIALNGTSKQFNVTWDQEKNAINMFSNTPYTPVGGEMAAGDGTSKAAKANVSKIYKNNEEITLVAYTIDGYNYFKLRDIAKAFDIGITWDGETLTAKIDTESSYVEE